MGQNIHFLGQLATLSDKNRPLKCPYYLMLVYHVPLKPSQRDLGQARFLLAGARIFLAPESMWKELFYIES